MTKEQLERVQKREPSQAAQFQAMKDVIDFLAVKIGELEEKQNVRSISLQPPVDYTC